MAEAWVDEVEDDGAGTFGLVHVGGEFAAVEDLEEFGDLVATGLGLAGCSVYMLGMKGKEGRWKANWATRRVKGEKTGRFTDRPFWRFWVY